MTFIKKKQPILKTTDLNNNSLDSTFVPIEEDIDNNESIQESVKVKQKLPTQSMKKEVSMPQPQPVEEVSLVQVPTATAIAFRLEDGSIVDKERFLLEIYKDIQQIKKAVC